MKLTSQDLNTADLVPALEQALRLEGIRSVSTERSAAFNSEVDFITISYKDKCQHHSPKKLVLKRNRDFDGAEECKLYRSLMNHPTMPGITPTCYYAYCDETTGMSAILLEDASDSHQELVDRALNIRGEGYVDNMAWNSVLKALAEFHALWWESPEIGTSASRFPFRDWFSNEANLTRFIETKRSEAEIFKTKHSRGQYELEIEIIDFLLQHLPDLWKPLLADRIQSRKNVTLTHGDCFCSQFLVSREHDGTSALIVDFQEASANFAAFDLGFLLSFFPPANQQDTIGSLRKYHAALTSTGAVSFTLDELVDDYRLVLCFLVLVPVWDHSYGASDSYWKPKLANVMRDFNALECLDFVKTTIR